MSRDRVTGCDIERGLGGFEEVSLVPYKTAAVVGRERSKVRIDGVFLHLVS